jgi:hypothetical protein
VPAVCAGCWVSPRVCAWDGDCDWLPDCACGEACVCDCGDGVDWALGAWLLDGGVGSGGDGRLGLLWQLASSPAHKASAPILRSMVFIR